MAKCKWCGKNKGLFESFTKYGFCENCNASVRNTIKSGLNAIEQTISVCNSFFQDQSGPSIGSLLERVNNAINIVDDLEKIRPIVPFFKSDTSEAKMILIKYKNKLILEKVKYIKEQQSHQELCISVPEPLKELRPWEISVSFGDSPSINFERVLYLAKQAPSFEEYEKEGIKVYQASYPYSKDNFEQYLMLFDLIFNWKSSFVIVNGKIMNKYNVSQLNSCVSQKIQSGNLDYCFFDGIQKNIFGCSKFSYLCNHDNWWEMSKFDGVRYKLNKAAIKKIEKNIPNYIKCCPFYRSDRILYIIDHLPDFLSKEQYEKCAHDYGPYYYAEDI